MNIFWEDGEVSPYGFDWLRDRMFVENKKQGVDQKWSRLEPKLWGSDLKPKTFEFNKVRRLKLFLDR